MTSTVANGGTIYKPVLIKDASPVITGKFNHQSGNLQLVKDGLFGVVNEGSGTGWAAKSPIASVAGKTGTAQVVAMKGGRQYLGERFRDHAWFVAYAPAEQPEVALSVLVEHGGHGGGAAAPIAKRAIDAFFKPENIVQPLKEAVPSKPNATELP
jgi:penicillin-binding protein 2